MKIITVIGARPQFIKAAAVSRSINKHKNINEVIVHTGQHFDKNMSDIFFEEMSIPKPNYNLEINSLSHGAMTGRMLEGLENIFIEEKPDFVLVYGDTNSTIAGALAAKKLNIKVAHVEAGLRSFNMNMPEEINRILTDRISDILFCPTDTAIENLKQEGFGNFQSTIVKSGDVMYDAALFYKERARKPQVDLPEDFILATIHRQENTDNLSRLQNIFKALDFISSQTKIVIPLHPRTKKKLNTANIIPENIIFIEPVGYLEMIWLITHSKLVMTDSGGLQKEAYFFEKPCITLRYETEWVELVKNGFNILAGAEYEKIIASYSQFLKTKPVFDKKLYGEGNASEIIVEKLLATQ
jgi:UDP-GlcNAc3NAcA epimerase